MTNGRDGDKRPQGDRRKRLEEELRANLVRRKERLREQAAKLAEARGKARAEAGGPPPPSDRGTEPEDAP